MSAKNRVLKGKLCACGNRADRWIGSDPECARCAKLEAETEKARKDTIARRKKRPYQYAPCAVDPYAVRLGTYKLTPL